MSQKLVLVTGVTGFIAGHVALHFLEAGYRVRGTTRGAKVRVLADTITLPGLEFVQVDDVASSDLTVALKDVYAVIHVASPLAGQSDVDGILKGAVDGTLNVLKQAAAAGVKKIVVTSSVGAVLDAGLEAAYGRNALSDSDWGEVTTEEVYAQKENPLFVYFASKILSEKATWKFAKEHSEVDIATILPSFVYGPFAPHFPYPSSPSALGTNSVIHSLMTGQTPFQPPPWFVDVRDIAKAHALALELPPAALEQKRFLINAGIYTWKEAAAHLNVVRPGIKTLPIEELPGLPATPTALDVSRSVNILGMEYIKPEKTVIDAADSIIEVQKSWA